MPALVKSSVGSPWGTSEELRTRRWPLPSKKRRKVSRISLPDQNFGCGCVALTLSSVDFDYRIRRKRAPTEMERALAPPHPGFLGSADSKGLARESLGSVYSKGVNCFVAGIHDK